MNPNLFNGHNLEAVYVHQILVDKRTHFAEYAEYL